MARLILVRHPTVAKAWSGRCYGQSDMGLSRAGHAMIAALVEQLAALQPDCIVHSDMRRTRALARPLARRLGVAPVASSLWRERDFGSWEGRSWNAIYRETGDAMDAMLTAPDQFRPGDGETTSELAQRTGRAMENLPLARCVVVISHGGPIACARAASGGLALSDIATLIPAVGTIVEL
jgi:broad specificity phosphatase PhoE